MSSIQAPVISELRPDGTKIVSVYDSKARVQRNIRVSAQEADEFVNSRQAKMDKASGRAVLAFLTPSVIGPLVGSVVSKGNRLLGALGGL